MGLLLEIVLAVQGLVIISTQYYDRLRSCNSTLHRNPLLQFSFLVFFSNSTPLLAGNQLPTFLYIRRITFFSRVNALDNFSVELR